MTDQDPNLYGQPSGFPPPPPAGYPPPMPGGYPPPPPAGYPPPPNPYGATYPQIGFGYASNPGGLGVRWGARIIDGFLVGILAWILAALSHSSSSILVTGLFTGVLMFGYFVAMEVTQGQTLGKKLLGLSVRGPGGAPKPDFKQSAIRNAFTLLPVVPYIGGLLGVIAIIVIAVTISSSPTKQGKHDEMAGGTQVVKG
ncbi:MAG: RDD family protein [Mycobacterium sp.]